MLVNKHNIYKNVINNYLNNYNLLKLIKYFKNHPKIYLKIIYFNLNLKLNKLKFLKLPVYLS